MIGKLEELVLLAVIKNGSRAVPSAVYEQICQSIPDNENISFGSIYTTLERLHKKGLLTMDVLIDSNGRSRKNFSISNEGRSLVTESVSRSIRLGGLQLAGG